jgi:hypothetical protein
LQAADHLLCTMELHFKTSLRDRSHELLLLGMLRDCGTCGIGLKLCFPYFVPGLTFDDMLMKRLFVLGGGNQQVRLLQHGCVMLDIHLNVSM